MSLKLIFAALALLVGYLFSPSITDTDYYIGVFFTVIAILCFPKDKDTSVAYAIIIGLVIIGNWYNYYNPDPEISDIYKELEAGGN